MGMVTEFKEFISRGNVIDLAVGVIIGAAFNGIVKSLVDQVVMPPIGLITGGIDFSELEWVLRPENPATAEVEKVAVQYGAFLNTVIQFLIVAWVVFLLVKGINTLRRQQAAIVEAGSMMYMDAGIQMDTVFGDGSAVPSGCSFVVGEAKLPVSVFPAPSPTTLQALHATEAATHAPASATRERPENLNTQSP